MRAINFGDVLLGSSVTKVIHVQNLSDDPALFQCYGAGDPNASSNPSMFRFLPMCGSIQGRFSFPVTITFTPTLAQNYYKRIYVMVRDQLPMYFDMVATAYDDKKRPAPLRMAHVDLYRRRLHYGMGKMTPEDIPGHLTTMYGDQPHLLRTLGHAISEDELEEQEVHEARSRQVCADTLLATVGNAATVSAAQILAATTAPGVAVPDFEAPAALQFFADNNDPAAEVAITESNVSFGACSRNRLAGSKTITVVNRTGAKVVCAWEIPEDSNGAAFVVLPQEQDIKAYGTATFKVAFRPKEDNFYYAQCLEAYVYYKTNRTFRLVNHDAFVPPFCVRTFVSGHTFAPQVPLSFFLAFFFVCFVVL